MGRVYLFVAVADDTRSRVRKRISMSMIVKMWRRLLATVFVVMAAAAAGMETSGGTPTFSVTVWRGETAYVPIPKGAADQDYGAGRRNS